MTQKIRIKLHAADGSKAKDFEFTFPAGTTEQHATAVFESLTTLAKYHPGTGKEIDRTKPTIIPSTKHVPCTSNVDLAMHAASNLRKTAQIITQHHTPTGSAPEAVKAKGSENRHAETHAVTVP